MAVGALLRTQHVAGLGWVLLRQWWERGWGGAVVKSRAAMCPLYLLLSPSENSSDRSTAKRQRWCDSEPLGLEEDAKGMTSVRPGPGGQRPPTSEE